MHSLVFNKNECHCLIYLMFFFFQSSSAFTMSCNVILALLLESFTLTGKPLISTRTLFWFGTNTLLLFFIFLKVCFEMADVLCWNLVT